MEEVPSITFMTYLSNILPLSSAYLVEHLSNVSRGDASQVNKGRRAGVQVVDEWYRVGMQGDPIRKV